MTQSQPCGTACFDVENIPPSEQKTRCSREVARRESTDIEHIGRVFCVCFFLSHTDRQLKLLPFLLPAICVDCMTYRTIFTTPLYNMQECATCQTCSVFVRACVYGMCLWYVTFVLQLTLNMLKTEKVGRPMGSFLSKF